MEHAVLHRFIPNPDVRERFETTIRAPAALVMRAATSFDMLSVPAVRAIFRLRELMLGSREGVPRTARGILDETIDLGWGVLAEEPGRFVAVGARCQPWLADVRFVAIDPAEFASFAAPGEVKIAWTLEADAMAANVTRFAQETRAVATDAQARAKFLRYWRWARFGIVGIRLLLLPAVRRAAERQWAAGRGGGNA
jgi:hypothetical protein